MGYHSGAKVAQTNMDYCIDIQNPKNGTNTNAQTGVASDITTGATVTVNGAVYNSTNKSFDFDGTNDYVQIAHDNYPATFADPFTIECWIYVPTGSTWDNGYRGSILCRGNYDGSHGLWRHSSDLVVSAWCRVRASDNTVTIKERTVSISNDVWTHLAMTWENYVLMAIYKNGELAQSYDPGDLNAAGSLYNADQNDWIFCGANAASGAASSYYDGQASMARMYRRALTAAEVMNNFNATRGRFGV